MKKIIFLMLFAIINWQHAHAQSFSNNGLRYNITSPTTVEVVGRDYMNYNYYDGLEIPQSVVYFSWEYGYDYVYNPDTGEYEILYISYPVGDGQNYTVTSISSWAFINEQFQTLIIPSTITTINDYAFSGCHNLTSVFCNATVPINITSSVFEGVNLGACSLTVPNESVSAYQAANVWQNFIPINNIYPPVAPASSLNFIASSNTVNLGQTLGNFGTGDFAIEMKVKTNPSSGRMYLVDKRSFCDRDNLLDVSITPEGYIALETYNFWVSNNYITGTISITDNTWHQITVTRTAGYLKIYVDGVLDTTSETDTAVDLNNNYTLVLGGDTVCRPYGQYFKGNLDEVRFWNKSLTQTEIQTSMNCEIPTSGNGLLANYHFNQGNSNDNNGAVASLVDSSGNNNNGTLLNFGLTGSVSNWSNDAGVASGVACATVAIITPTFAAVAALCSGAQITALPTSSSEGITGTWSPEINFLATTTYTFAPNAGQSATTATLTITVNPTVTTTFEQVPAICAGTMLDALPTTSNEGITGTWSPALNNLATTTYLFIPDAGQCATTATMTITVNPLVTPTFTEIASICSGATLDALPTTSNEGIVGTWSPALNNLETTTYTFTPDAAAPCATTATLTVTVNVSAQPTVGASSTADIEVTMTGGCSDFNGVYTYNGLLNGKNNYVYSANSTFKIGYDGEKWVLYIYDDFSHSIFENTTVSPGLFPPATGWSATQCGRSSLTYSFINTSQTFCAGATIANLDATGTDLKWFNVASGGTALANSTVLVSGDYFVTQTIGGCESARTSLSVIITPLVTPTFTAVAPICSGATIADLSTTSNEGFTGTWSPAINNLATTTYTFTPNEGQCATTATLEIVVKSAGTIAGGNVTVCAPATTLNLSGVSTVFTNSTTLTLNDATLGSTVVWQRSTNFVNATNAAPVWVTATNTITVNNNVVINGSTLTVSNLSTTIWYRTKVTNGSCISYADPVKITIAPVARNRGFRCPSGVCYGDNITFTGISYIGSSIAWEVSTTSATSGFSTVQGQNELVFTMNNVTNPPLSKFYVRSVVTSGDCSIARSSVKTITVNPLSVAGTVVGAGPVCSGSNANLRLLGFTGGVQWMYSTDGTTFYNVPFLSTTLGYQNPSGASTFTTTSAVGRASSYAVNNITGTIYFKAVVKSGACSATESNVVVCNTGTTATAPFLNVENASICSGSATSIYLPLNVGFVRFQKSNNWSSATPTWTYVNLPMTQTLENGAYGAFSTGALSTSTAYRAMASIGSCAPVVYSAKVVISVGECITSREIETLTESKIPFDVVAYPNPSNNVFNFKINGANDDTVSVLVFDMLGKQIENKVVKANDIENVSLGQNYSTGVYNVIVSQGMNTKTVRLVKK